MMGLFWGSKKNVPAPQPRREPTEHEKLVQKLTEPLELGFVFSGGGPMNASEEFTFLTRNMNDGILKNNKMLRELRDMVRELIVANQDLRERVEQLEQKEGKNYR